MNGQGTAAPETGGRLEGKVAFITGAARGQGRSHAVRFAEEGADIIAIDNCADVETVPYAGARPEDLQETVRQVEALDRRIVAAQADVRDGEGLARALSDGVDQLGRLDLVAASAGIGAFGLLQDLDEQEWSEMIDVNLSGVWRTCKVSIPHMVAAGNGGSIVITNSGAGLKSAPMLGHYVSAKHGLIGLMRTLALELAPHVIRVNSVHPTNVDTEMIHNDAFYELFLPDETERSREKVAELFRQWHPLEIPWVDSVDISNAILFLASDEARYITGATLPVDGGLMLK
jgi:(+)-trans-carveol dehydrogenase